MIKPEDMSNEKLLGSYMVINAFHLYNVTDDEIIRSDGEELQIAFSGHYWSAIPKLELVANTVFDSYEKFKCPCKNAKETARLVKYLNTATNPHDVYSGDYE